MLAPLAPHAAEEMWEGLGHSGGLLGSEPPWPVADPELARSEELEIPIQVNGKLRSRLITSPEVSEEELKTAALEDERIRSLVEGHEVVKVVVVPRRLVNVVIK
jgi:leucyl-tRNA synthetase